MSAVAEDVHKLNWFELQWGALEVNFISMVFFCECGWKAFSLNTLNRLTLVEIREEMIISIVTHLIGSRFKIYALMVVPIQKIGCVNKCEEINV